MATLVADLFADDIGINILSFLDHKTEIKHRIKLIKYKLKSNDYAEALCY